jgi:hypothetical protein
MRRIFALSVLTVAVALPGSACAANTFVFNFMNSPMPSAGDLEVVFSANLLTATQTAPANPAGNVSLGGKGFMYFVTDIFAGPLPGGSTVQLTVTTNAKGLGVKNAFWTGIPNFDVPGTHEQRVGKGSIKLVNAPGPAAAIPFALGLLRRRKKK